MKKKSASKPVDEGFLTTAAQAIGSTLGQLAKKAGVVSAPAAAEPERKKAGMKKRVAVKKKPAAKKRATPQKALQKRK